MIEIEELIRELEKGTTEQYGEYGGNFDSWSLYFHKRYVSAVQRRSREDDDGSNSLVVWSAKIRKKLVDKSLQELIAKGHSEFTVETDVSESYEARFNYGGREEGKQKYHSNITVNLRMEGKKPVLSLSNPEGKHYF